MMMNRHCDCDTQGITDKGLASVSKIWRCDNQHGFICPFDGWQFKTAVQLQDHFEHQNVHTSYPWESHFPVTARFTTCFGIIVVSSAIARANSFVLSVKTLNSNSASSTAPLPYFQIPSHSGKSIQKCIVFSKRIVGTTYFFLWNETKQTLETLKEGHNHHFYSDKMAIQTKDVLKFSELPHDQLPLIREALEVLELAQGLHDLQTRGYD